MTYAPKAAGQGCYQDTADFSISQPVDSPTLRVLSFGAGVQSTVLLLMAARHELGPMPDIAIFGDTQFEPAAVYDHLEWCKDEVNRLTNGQLQIHTVTHGSIKNDHLAGLNSTGQRFASMPLYTANGAGMGRRQCTNEYKIKPTQKKVRELLGVAKGERVPKSTVVEQWIGISTDELQRLKYNRLKWITNRWPLIEMRMNRADCHAWFNKHYPGQPLVKSACIVCPFKDNSYWRKTKNGPSNEWQEAVEFDEAIRANGSTLRGMDAQQFVHRSGTPLRTANLDDNSTLDLFQGECEGMCGV